MPANVVSTGAIDTLPVVLSASDTLYPDDRKGTLARIDSLPPGISTPDNIFYFSINGEYWRRVIDGPMRASYCGIYADGTDQTAKIAAAFTAGVQAIVFDNPNGGVFIVNGTLNIPAGRMLQFYPGNKLSGTGTLNKGVIEADYNSQIFDPTLTVNPESVTGNKVSVKWFGAKAGGTGNDAPAIQAAIDMVARNNSYFKTVWLPGGTYRIEEPLMLYSWDGTNYSFHTIYLEGDGAFWPGSNIGPIIVASFRDKFAIGIQSGKGCKIKGLLIRGGFVPPFTGPGYDFYSCSFENFNDGVSRDSPYSPYAGIVIDPFSRSCSEIPDDGGYPGMTSWYRGTGGSTGSTGTEIEDVVINNFVIGICSSPNGKTRSAELTLISRYQFTNMKLAISGGQDQEKMNKVQFAAGWANIHTVFATGYYGAKTPGNWHIEEINLAGNVNRFIYNIQGNYYPTYISKVFAESLGSFGTMTSRFIGSEVDGCVLNFQHPTVTGIQYNIEATNVKISNSLLRYYGLQVVPICIRGRATYENVNFNATPFVSPEDLGQYGTATFLNCTANTFRLGIATVSSLSPNQTHLVYASPYAPLGSFKTYNPISYESNGRAGYIFKGDQVAIPTFLGSHAITITGTNREFVINLTLANLYKAAVNAIVYRVVSNQFQPIGVITNINTSTGDVTVSYTASYITNGTYNLTASHPLICGTPFLGDVVAGTNTITNVKIADGLESALLNCWIKSPMHVTDSYLPYVRITGWDSTTRVLTVSANASASATGTFFCNEGTQYFAGQAANTAVPRLRPLQKGSEFSLVNAFGKNGVKQDYVILQSGYLDPVAASDTRRAYYFPKDAFEFTGNPEGLVAFPSGALVRDINTGELYIKTTTDNTQMNGGTNGWVKQKQQLSGSITSDAAVLIPTGDVASKIVVTSASTQTGLLIGTSPGGSEIATINFTGAPNAGVAVTAAVLGTGSNSIYFTNIGGTVNYRIVLE